MSRPDPRAPRAVVTGASSGIGAAFAERLARAGHEVVLVARRLDRLEAQARHLAARYGVEAAPVGADLSDPDDLEMLERRLGEDSAIGMLVNNAGFGAFMPFLELEADRAEELIRVQVVAVARLTRAVLPGMIGRGRGAVINVSSRLAWSAALPSPPLPARATYAATKAYINTFTRILDSELAGTGVRVQALCPGLVRTEFFGGEGAAMSAPSFPEAMLMAPESVVDASLRGLELGEVLCVPSLDDPEALEAIEREEARLFARSNGPDPAARYGVGPP